MFGKNFKLFTFHSCEKIPNNFSTRFGASPFGFTPGCLDQGFPSSPNLGRCYSQTGAVLICAETIFNENFRIFAKFFQISRNLAIFTKTFQIFQKIFRKFSECFEINQAKYIGETRIANFLPQMIEMVGAHHAKQEKIFKLYEKNKWKQ